MPTGLPETLQTRRGENYTNASLPTLGIWLWKSIRRWQIARSKVASVDGSTVEPQQTFRPHQFLWATFVPRVATIGLK